MQQKLGKQSGVRKEKLEAPNIKIGRVIIILCVVIASVGGIFLRVIQLQGREYTEWSELALRQNSTAVEIQGARGTLLDREGRALAVSIEGSAIGIRPKIFFRDETKTNAKLAALADVLAVSEKELEKQIKGENKFFWLARGVSREELLKLAGMTLTGVEVFPEFSRNYPQGNLARMILGQVSGDGKGIAGIELALDDRLKAAMEKISVKRDARGKLLEGSTDNSVSEIPEFAVPDLSSFDFVSPAVATVEDGLRDEGTNIKLTIDATLQGILEDELKIGLKDSQAKKLMGVLMNAETGELLALGQAIYGKTQNKNEVKKYLSPEELRNPIVQDIFEPGSTFKPLVAAMVMDQGKVTPNEIINCQNGHYPVGKYIVHDAHPVGIVPFSEVLVRSSNVGIAKVGARLGGEGLRKSIEKFGFGKSTGAGLPGEQQGLLQSGKWGAIQVATNSFGQGISVTALQLVSAYGALANGGMLVKPSIIKLETGAKPEGTRIFSEKTAKKITEILVGVTEDDEGTGKKASIEGIKVSGKTGTAQKPRLHGRGYETNKVFASFIGYVDASHGKNPEHLVMFIGVDEPGVYPRWGGVVAAPVFKRAMERILAHKMTQG